jgi:hypothetical protein
MPAKEIYPESIEKELERKYNELFGEFEELWEKLEDEKNKKANA